MLGEGGGAPVSLFLLQNFSRVRVQPHYILGHKSCELRDDRKVRATTVFDWQQIVGSETWRIFSVAVASFLFT